MQPIETQNDAGELVTRTQINVGPAMGIGRRPNLETYLDVMYENGTPVQLSWYGPDGKLTTSIDISPGRVNLRSPDGPVSVTVSTLTGRTNVEEADDDSLDMWVAEGYPARLGKLPLPRGTIVSNLDTNVPQYVSPRNTMSPTSPRRY